MNRMRGFGGLVLGAMIASCGSPAHPETADAAKPAHLSQAALAPETKLDAVPQVAAPSEPMEAKDAALEWIGPQLPPGGHVAREGGAIVITHEVQPKDTAASIAKAYLNVSEVYLAPDLMTKIQKKYPALKVGLMIVIFELV